MLGRVRLKSNVGSHWDGSWDIGALGKRQSGFFRGAEHEPRAVGDEQSNNGDLLRSGKLSLWKWALLLFDYFLRVFRLGIAGEILCHSYKYKLDHKIKERSHQSNI